MKEEEAKKTATDYAPDGFKLVDTFNGWESPTRFSSEFQAREALEGHNPRVDVVPAHWEWRYNYLHCKVSGDNDHAWMAP